jgi:hypothetical protein
MKKDGWLYGTAFVSGILVWIVVSSFSGKREAWDSASYFTFGMPVLCLIAGLLGYAEPERPWRWGTAPLVGQGVCMFVSQGLGNLFPLGIVVLGLFALPSIVTAKIGAAMSHRMTRDRAAPGQGADGRRTS